MRLTDRHKLYIADNTTIAKDFKHKIQQEGIGRGTCALGSVARGTAEVYMSLPTLPGTALCGWDSRPGRRARVLHV